TFPFCPLRLAMPIRILLVEDDAPLSALIADYLRQHHYQVDTLFDGAGAVPAIVANRPDLVLLDVNLPGKDGFEICREARKQYDGVIIMVTARDEPFDELLGLEFGADDYVHKPVEPRILLARIKAQLRRAPARAAESTAPQPERYAFGKFSIDRT
ncbi:response regulator, partial [Bacillus halotolerans]|nr:response regulator [Bacillus halotolerans]